MRPLLPHVRRFPADLAPAAGELVFLLKIAFAGYRASLISLRLFVATLWAMKGLAPTRLALAGAAKGLLAGAIGALV